MKDNKDIIIKLFYDNHLKVIEIANKMKISSAYVTKIIKDDNRYIKEKTYRKNISHQNRKIKQNNFIKSKREKKRIEDNYEFMKSQHIQAVSELSKSKKLSDENYRKWNYSAYKYNASKRRFEFDHTLGRSYDVPKYIKER